MSRFTAPFGMKSGRRSRDQGMSDSEPPKKRRLSARPRASQACRACAAAKVRCDDLQICRRCQDKGTLCVRAFQMVENSRYAAIVPSAASSVPAPSRPSLLQSRDYDKSRPVHGTKNHATRACSSVTESGLSADVHQGEPSSNVNVQHPALSSPLSTVLPDASTNHQLHHEPSSVGPSFDSFLHHDWQLNDAFDFILSTSQEWPGLGTFDYAFGEPFPNSIPSVQAREEARDTQSGYELDVEAPTPSNRVSGQVGVSAEAVRAYDNTLGNWYPRPKDYLAPDKASISIAPDVQKAMLGCLGNLDPGVINHRLSAARRDEIVVVVAGRFSAGQTLQAVPNFPSVEILDELLKIFLGTQRGPLTSMIHLPTFNPDNCDLWLLMTCIASGAVTSPNLAAHKFGLALLEVLRWYLPAMADKDNSLTRCLSFVQSLVMSSDIALWSGDKRKSEISDIVTEFAATMIRHARRLSGASYSLIVPKTNEAPPQLDETWRRWIEQESTKRTVYGYLMRCTQRAILRNTVVTVSCTEISVPFPEQDRLWFANSATEWASIHSELQNRGDNRRTSLGDVLSRPTSLRTLPMLQDASLARLIMIYSLTSMLVEDRRRSRLFNMQGEGYCTNGLSSPSAIGHIALLIDELYGTIDRDNQHHGSSVEAFMLEFYGLYSTTPNYLAEALLGNERFVSAHDAVRCLREWRQTRQARSAVWHAGQMFRLCRKVEPTHLTNFLIFSMYQAVLCFWMYGKACETAWPANRSVTQNPIDGAPADRLKIRLDEAESLQSQRWVSHNRGIPYIAKATDIVGMSDLGVELIPIAAEQVSEDGGFMPSLVVALETHFSPENTGRRFPILDYVCQILRALDKFCS
ncbi:hypothetical protein IWW34DRAFT_737944 [Fusarium oxysporum f. sp. albedinis]|nr:hypothetical protein IWW34DRAFT_737944 [Fusarium oxysporum f. sp. albedinis]